MKLSDIINKKWLDSESLSDAYLQAEPFPHIVLHDFIDANLLKSVAEEFPDLAKQKSSVIKFENNREIIPDGGGIFFNFEESVLNILLTNLEDIKNIKTIVEKGYSQTIKFNSLEKIVSEEMSLINILLK